MRRRHAFTLVELLVVIGIIALLISILLPALNRAREQARLVQCTSNLRQFAIGLRLYAEANKGVLPEGKGSTNDSALGSPQDTTTVGPGGVYNPEKTVLWHVGRLWQQKYLNVGRVAYCPANYDAPAFGWNVVGDRWPSTYPIPPATSADPLRSDYAYNMNWRYFGIGAANRMYLKKLQAYPATRLLAADIFRSQAYTSHKGRNGQNPSWNLVFPDGHAVTVTSSEIWRQMGIQGEAGKDGAGWNTWENYRDMLETLAGGRKLEDNPFAFVKGGGNTGSRVYHKKFETVWGIGTMEGRSADMTAP